MTKVEVGAYSCAMTNHYHHHQHTYGLFRGVIWGTCILAAAWIGLGLIALVIHHPWLLLIIVPTVTTWLYIRREKRRERWEENEERLRRAHEAKYGYYSDPRSPDFGPDLLRKRQPRP